MKKYDGWLLDNNIIKRSVAIFGHNLLGYIIISVCIMLPLGIIIGLLSV